MSLIVKICGLSDEATLDAALDAGADLVGLVFHAASPRNLGVARAAGLARRVGRGTGIVALTVDADDRVLADIVERVRPTWLQLHGHETPERVAEIGDRFGVRIIKSVAVHGKADVASAAAFAEAADMILFDARPPAGAVLPGGNGVPFDWSLLRGLQASRPFLVSGGLNPRNVGEAIAIALPHGVDVSSGVESARGRKDANLIRAFVAAARLAALAPAETAS